MRDRKFGMVSVCALCNDSTKPVITIPILEKTGEDSYISYEVHPIGCSIAGYQPVRLITHVDGYKNIDAPDGILNITLSESESIQIQFTWDKEWEEPWGEYETDMLEITYLF